MISVLFLLISFASESVAFAFSQGIAPRNRIGNEWQFGKKTSSENPQVGFDFLFGTEGDDGDSGNEDEGSQSEHNSDLSLHQLSAFFSLYQGIIECSSRNYVLEILNLEKVSLVVLHKSWKSFPG